MLCFETEMCIVCEEESEREKEKLSMEIRDDENE